MLFDTPRGVRRGLLATGSPLLLASPELKNAASLFLDSSGTSSFSFLGHGLYGSSSRGLKTLQNSVSVKALVDSGADVHILSYEDARKMFTDVEPSSLRIIGVNGSTSRAACQGSLVVGVQSPSGLCHLIDLGTAHSMQSCPQIYSVLVAWWMWVLSCTLNKMTAGFNPLPDSKVRGRVSGFL